MEKSKLNQNHSGIIDNPGADVLEILAWNDRVGAIEDDNLRRIASSVYK